MQILITASTEAEIEPFIGLHPSADILITGIGIPAAVYHLCKRLQQMDYDLVIQAGIAGVFSESKKLGEVVVVKQDTFADIGVRTKKGFATIFDNGLADPDTPPYKNGWLINEDISHNSLIYDAVSAVTVNTITDDVTVTHTIVEKWQPVIETMEGAAFHYVCMEEEISFLQLRSISNHVGERDKTKWDMQLAIKNLNTQLSLLYEHFMHEPWVSVRNSGK